MGYQYALHQRKKKLREEKDMFMRSQGDDSMSSGEYWDEYSDASERSMEIHRDPKHNRRTTTHIRKESYAKSQSAQ
jgi:predicted HD phosphohydrolase